MKKSLTKFCKEHELSKTTVHRRCKELKIDTSDGLDDSVQSRLLIEFDIETAKKVDAAIVEVGNHQVVVENPVLPDVYTLEGLRSSETLRLQDPLAAASQFLAVANQLQTAMKQDIQSREQHLDQVRAAHKAVEKKASELELDARMYELRAELLDKRQTEETQELQEKFSQLNDLGKPQSPLP